MSNRLDPLLAANRAYAEAYSGRALAPQPRRGLAVLTCMDARIVPHRMLGLEEGDAHVIRNAGGRASDDALRSLVVSTRLLDTREILVVQHTGCGMLGLDEDDLKTGLAEETGVDVSSLDFLSFTDLEDSVRSDVGRIRSSPLLASGCQVSGYVFEVETGRLREVAE